MEVDKSHLYEVAYAKSGRSKCSACKEPIPDASLRFASKLESGSAYAEAVGHDVVFWRHLNCVTARVAKNVREACGSFDNIPGFEILDEADQTLFEAVFADALKESDAKVAAKEAKIKEKEEAKIAKAAAKVAKAAAAAAAKERKAQVKVEAAAAKERKAQFKAEAAATKKALKSKPQNVLEEEEVEPAEAAKPTKKAEELAEKPAEESVVEPAGQPKSEAKRKRKVCEELPTTFATRPRRATAKYM